MAYSVHSGATLLVEQCNDPPCRRKAKAAPSLSKVMTQADFGAKPD